MQNPWLNIPHFDYENHMLEVGQARVLNDLTKYCIEKYKPESFALLGCATGNGLEHINKDKTNTVYAIDINQEYLNETQKKFRNQINDLIILNKDIQNDELYIENVNLFFVALILEYVNPLTTLKKIIKSLSEEGILFIVIQKSKQTTFVSKTKYKSLETLADICNEVNENEIYNYVCQENIELLKREEIELTKNKSFITLEYKKKKIASAQHWLIGNGGRSSH